MIGQVLGSYRIVAELGKGGMGVVYRGEHVQLGRPAAIKVLLPQMSSDPQIVQRFFNEARAASSIDHPGIVEIYDYGQDGGRAYIVMALLRGESLDHRLMRPIAPLEAASLIAQVAGALAAAHARGIVHRDLKPDNIFLVPNELLPGGIQVKLLDFGIAKLAGEGAAGHRTQTGVLIGTPAYMSPEQCMGRADLDHRTDLYAVGCILYHMLCGRPPFLSDQGTGVMIAMHLRDPVPDPRSLAPHLPEPLVAIMLRLLEKDPAARFQSAHELRQALVTAGAIAPMTAPGARLDPPDPPERPDPSDPYGATVASGAPPTLPPAMPTSMAPMASSHRDAYAATAALAPLTTRSDAAAELLTHPARVHSRGGGDGPGGGGPGAARAGDKRGVWMALGALLLVGGGVAATVAVTSRDDMIGRDTADPGVRDPGPEQPDRGGSGSAQDSSKPIVPPVPPPDLAAGEPPCPPGQLRSDDTRGQCCWAGQAWSTPNKRCIGAPTCPPGTRASGEQCVAVVAEQQAKPPRPGDQSVPLPADPLAPPPAVELSAASFAPGAAIGIRFTPGVRSVPGRRAWVTVAPAGSAPTSYGAWEYVDDKARRATLRAPGKPGAYEVRLHTDYPARSFNLVRAVPFAVEAPAEAPDRPSSPDPPDPPPGITPPSGQRFSLAARTVPAGGKIELRFPGPLRAAPREQFWVTVIQAGAPDDKWGNWEYVKDGARAISLGVPTQAGAYEIRLHANYPKQTTNVVHRASIRVE